jgi:oxygen-dependent protoporphyrinogen oxidase
MNALAEAAGRAVGPALRLGSPVSELARVDGAWRIRFGEDRSWTADEVLLALPGHRAATLAQAFDPQLAAALEETPFSSVAVVGLAFRASDLARPLDGYGYLVTRAEGMATLGVVWESSLFDGRAPEGHVLVRAILGGPRRPDVADRSPEERIALARQEFAAVMGTTAEPVRAWSWRWPRAIAQYTRGHSGRRDAARARATPGSRSSGRRTMACRSAARSTPAAPRPIARSPRGRTRPRRFPPEPAPRRPADLR